MIDRFSILNEISGCITVRIGRTLVPLHVHTPISYAGAIHAMSDRRGLRKCVYTRAGAAAIILFHRLRHIIEIGEVERRNV